MYAILMTILVWIVGLKCIPVMKKIEPDNKWYPVYAIVICILYTIWTIVYFSLQSG